MDGCGQWDCEGIAIYFGNWIENENNEQATKFQINAE